MPVSAVYARAEGGCRARAAPTPRCRRRRRPPAPSLRDGTTQRAADPFVDCCAAPSPPCISGLLPPPNAKCVVAERHTKARGSAMAREMRMLPHAAATNASRARRIAAGCWLPQRVTPQRRRRHEAATISPEDITSRDGRRYAAAVRIVAPRYIAARSHADCRTPPPAAAVHHSPGDARSTRSHRCLPALMPIRVMVLPTARFSIGRRQPVPRHFSCPR